MKAFIAAALAVCAGAAAAQDEVPFITTPDHVTLAMLELAGVGPSDRVLDLGSGDGRIVITAARRFGARGLGVEIVPDLVAQSRSNARKAGVESRAEFRVQDLFDTELAGYSVITMYLLPEVNLQLRPRLLQLPPGTRIVSHDWDMGDWPPERSLTLDAPDKPIGRDKKSTVHLWRVPARVGGTWCAAGGATLHIVQRLAAFSASVTARGANAPAWVFDGQVGIDRLGNTAAELRIEAAALVVHRAPAPGLPFAGQRFTPATGARCR
jgi:hypothetical protein